MRARQRASKAAVEGRFSQEATAPALEALLSPAVSSIRVFTPRTAHSAATVDIVCPLGREGEASCEASHCRAGVDHGIPNGGAAEAVPIGGDDPLPGVDVVHVALRSAGSRRSACNARTSARARSLVSCEKWEGAAIRSE
eukprot:scaffold142082_cov32-Tisochrysis_lutea.AAC.2